MEASTLKPFVRKGLDILFVGLNPAKGSSRKRHYFSVRAAFWDQLFRSGLITRPVDKDVADKIVFRSTEINRNGWNYGITDLVTAWAESDSTKVEPTDEDCSRLADDIRNYRPRLVVLLHSKVRNKLAAFLGMSLPRPYGALGRWLTNVPSEFFSVPFPHGNSIHDAFKIRVYKEIRAFAEKGAGHGQLSGPARGSGEPNGSEGGQPMLSSSKLERARQVDGLIEKYLRETGADIAKPKDVMPFLIQRGVFRKDHREGFPLRRLLNELADSGTLSAMRTAHYEQKAKNRLWHFRLPK